MFFNQQSFFKNPAMLIGALTIFAGPALADQILVSSSPDRSGATPLNGQTISDRVYIFFANSTPSGQIEDVEFLLDGKRQNTDGEAPYDFVGGDAAAALPFDTNKVAKKISTDPYRLQAVMTLTGGATQSVDAEFFIGAAATSAKALVVSRASFDAPRDRLILYGLNFDSNRDKVPEPVVTMDLKPNPLPIEDFRPDRLIVRLSGVPAGDHLISIALDGQPVPGLTDSLHAEVLVTLGATELICEGCVSESEVSFPFAAADAPSGKALNSYQADFASWATSADTAATSDQARNADRLNGLDSSNFAGTEDIVSLQGSIDGVTIVLCQAVQQMAGNPSPEAIALCGDSLFKLVFATSTTYDGDLVTPGGGATGLESGDKICNARAQAGGLTGTYKAWLSTSAVDAKDRFTPSTVPYRRVDGVQVADNVADMLDCSDECLDAPILLDEFGAFAPFTVWTGTDGNSGSKGFLNQCLDWTTSSAGAFTGDARATGPRWTGIGWRPCTDHKALYCIQE